MLRLLAVTVLLGIVAGCASVDTQLARPPSYALEDPSRTALGRAFAAPAAAQAGRSGFHVIDTGVEALQSRAALADAAERSLDLQYYSVDDDRSTDVLLQRLAAAGARGVRVRILLDDVHPVNRDFASRASALVPNAEVRLFNPFRTGSSSLGRLLEFIGDAARLNRRMHNKLWVADNAVGIVGGRNLGDEYFDTDLQANFSDLDLLAVGPVVRALSRCFDDYWNSAAAVPLAAFRDAALGDAARQHAAASLEERLSGADAQPYRRWLDASGLAPALMSAELPLHWASAQASCDRPDKPAATTSDDLLHHWLDADGAAVPTRAELIVVSPYFIPSRRAVQHLGEMNRRGVRVAVLTNSLASTDSPAAHGGYARYRAELLRQGVELFELRPQPGAPHPLRHRWRSPSPASLHAKIVIADRSRAIIGSNNQDPRSRRHNTESWIAIDNPELVSKLVALFDESTQHDHSYRVVLREGDRQRDALSWITEDQGKTVHHDSEPGTSWWLRVWASVLATVVPEDLL